MLPKSLFVGLTTVDIQYFIDDFPESNVKVKTQRPTLLVGGPSTNAAVAFSFLAGSANLISSVGTNSFQQLVQSDFAGTNIHHTDLSENKAVLPVLATVITSNNGDRTIFTHNPEDIETEIAAKKIIAQVKPDFLFVDGFYPNIALQFAKAASALNIPVIFDGGSWKPHLVDLLPFVDIAICSANFFPPSCTNSQSVFSFLKEKGIKHGIITRGSNSILYDNTTSISEIPVENICATDTLGAGDFFHGAFCYYYLESKNIMESILKAALLATQTCKFIGTREWFEKLERETFL